MGKEIEFRALRKKCEGWSALELKDPQGTLITDGFQLFDEKTGKQLAIIHKPYGEKYFEIKICDGVELVDNRYLGKLPRTKQETGGSE